MSRRERIEGCDVKSLMSSNLLICIKSIYNARQGRTCLFYKLFHVPEFAKPFIVKTDQNLFAVFVLTRIDEKTKSVVRCRDTVPPLPKIKEIMKTLSTGKESSRFSHLGSYYFKRHEAVLNKQKGHSVFAVG